MNATMFSIIVPIYKVEKYLMRCIDSVLAQTYSDLEIILVDDGSPDACPQICDEYAQEDTRIRVVHQKNGGLSDARNTGIKLATGTYIVFLDSDDALTPTACADFAARIAGGVLPDVLAGSACRICGEDRNYMNNELLEGVTSGQDHLLAMLSASTSSMTAWCNIYRRIFLLEENLWFEKGLLHEDERWTPLVFLKAKSVLNTNLVFYTYYIREDSITQSKSKQKNAIHIIETVQYLKPICLQLENELLKAKLMDHLVMLYLSAFYMGELYDVPQYIDKTFAIDYAQSKRNKKKARLFSLSPHLYCSINRWIKGHSQ